MIQIKVSTKTSTLPTDNVQRYMHKEDKQISWSSWGGGVRPCAPCPAVWVMKDDQHTFFDRQWQYYLIAINYNMDLEDVAALLDYRLAFANRTGLTNPADQRANWILGKYTSKKPPQLDKVRTCSRSVVTGTEVYSILQAIKSVRGALQGFQRSRKGNLRAVRYFLTSKNMLNVKTFDSNKLPPLKEGRSYPNSVSEINPDDYLYLPQYNREMFLVATIVNKSGECVQFPRGALYPWTGDRTTYSFVPHISNWTYGPILDILDNYVKLPIGSPIPSPYRNE